MDNDVIRRILQFADDNCKGKSPCLVPIHNVPEQLRDIEWNILDGHLKLATECDWIEARRQANGVWIIKRLTPSGHLRLEGTKVETLKRLVETIRQASEQAEASAQEANKISRRANRIAVWSIVGFLFCAFISLPFLAESIAFWMRLLGW
jgi:hypothetical protein